MSKGIIYIDYDEALNIYGKMIDASDGGFEGVRDEGGIRATLDFVQNDLYYPTFADKLTYLMYRFCSGHFFNDGNKRIALTLGAYFLHKNNGSPDKPGGLSIQLCKSEKKEFYIRYSS